MASSKRKPLSDITNITLTPISALQKLVAATSSSKLCNSNSTNQKTISESSSKSGTSIGSSNVSVALNSKKSVQFQRPTPVIHSVLPTGGIGSKDAAHNRKQITEKSKNERDADVVVINTPVEKRKDKGKAIAEPLSSSPSEKAKDNQNGKEGILKHSRSSNVIIKETGQEFLNPSSFLVPRAKDSGNPLNTVNSHEKTREKGKAIAVPLSKSPYEKTKDNRNGDEGYLKHTRSSNLIIKENGQDFHNSSSFLVQRAKDRRMPLNTVNSNSHEKTREKGKAVVVPLSSSPYEEKKDNQKGNERILKHAGSSNLIIKETEQGFRNSSSFLVQRAKDCGTPLNTVNSHEKTRDKGKANAVPLSSSPYEKPKDNHNGNEGILNHSRSSNLIIKETGQDIRNSSSFLVQRAKDSEKPLDTVYSHEKTMVKGKTNVQPSGIIEIPEHVAVKSLPRRRQGEKRKFGAGASSCPPVMRTKSIENNLNEAGDMKSLKSFTDPNLKRRKKTRSRIKKTGELAQDSNDKLPEDFIEQQRAYFKEVDDFELAEEEVGPDELD